MIKTYAEMLLSNHGPRTWFRGLGMSRYHIGSSLSEVDVLLKRDDYPDCGKPEAGNLHTVHYCSTLRSKYM